MLNTSYFEVLTTRTRLYVIGESIVSSDFCKKMRPQVYEYIFFNATSCEVMP